jgi:hypothetical protein
MKPPPNQSMKPTAPFRNTSSVFPTTPCRGLSPSRWAVFTPADSSYEIVTPGLKDGDTNGVFLRCRIHGYLGYADATVFDGVRRRTKIP